METLTSLSELRAFETHRSRLYKSVLDAAPDLRTEELDAHFASMPLRYWPRVDGPTLRWHLSLVHTFFDGLARNGAAAALPVVRLRHFPDRGISEVVVCAGDRLGLLSKIAGAFAAVGLSIVRADIFTRADDVVLDVFQVCGENLGHVEDISRLKQMEQLLIVALGPHAEGEVALRTWMLHAGKWDPVTPTDRAKPPSVTLASEEDSNYTLLQVEAADRVGLLYDILRALSNCEVDIAHAVIVTDAGEAADVFFLTEADGSKITDAKRLEQIRQTVLEMLTRSSGS